MNRRHKDAVIRKYNQTAGTYDTLYEMEQNAKYDSTLSIVRLSLSDLVLDMGCGTGFLIPLLASRVDKVVGMDISINMLEVAKKRASRFSNVSLILADVEHSPIRDNAFSKIFVFTVLQNVSSNRRVLSEIKRIGGPESIKVVTVLKKGGQDRAMKGLSSARNRILFVRDSEEFKDVIVVYS